MSENLTIVQITGGGLVWREPGTGQDRDLSEDISRQALSRELRESAHRVVFAVPGGELRLLELDVAAEERRHLDSALPFMLEEQLSEDIEELHFPRTALASGRYGVAVVSRAQMDSWQLELGEFAAHLPWIPEALLLPWESGVWTLVVEEQRSMLRYGECLGATVEPAILKVLLDSLAADGLPDRLVVYGFDESQGAEFLPDDLQSLVEWRRGGLDEALILSTGAADALDLRQGDYAPRLPYEHWWSLWRTVAAVLVVAVVLHGVSGWLDYRRLERQNVALRQEIETLYREINPRGAVSDPERQLRQQLGDLSGGRGGTSFSGLLAPLGSAMAKRDDMLLASLNYSQRSGELRINLLAPSFAEVEGLREDLVNAGLDANLENSSRSGDRVRARLRLGGGA